MTRRPEQLVTPRARARARALRRWRRSVAGRLDAALRADRRRQLVELERAPGAYSYRHRLLAWAWWGWDLVGRGGLGYPGLELGEHRLEGGRWHRIR